MDIIKNKLINSVKIVSHVTDYFIKLKPLLEDKYADEDNLLSNSVHNFDQQSAEISANIDVLIKVIEMKSNPLRYNSLINGIFVLYHSVMNYYLGIEHVMSIFDVPQLHADNIDTDRLSQTYRLEVAEFYSSLLLQYHKFHKQHLADDEQLIKYLVNLIHSATMEYTSSDSIQHALKYIQSRFYEYKNTVALYTAIMQDLIDYFYTDGKKESKLIMFYIIDLIEYDKDAFLSNVVNKFKSNVNAVIHLENPALKRFGLIPVTDSMNLSKLVSLITNNQSNSVNMKKYAKEHNACFIIMHHVVYTPIEYNLRTLIDKNIAKDLIQPDEYGVTNKTVSRYTTIQVVGGPDNMDSNKLKKSCDKNCDKNCDKKEKKSKEVSSFKKWDYSFEIIGNYENKLVDTFFVLETLDNENYRCLAPWLVAKNLGIPRFRVKALIQYLTNANKPDRVIGYHSAVMKKATSCMFIKRAMSIDAMEEQSRLIDTQLIKNNIHMNIRLTLEEMIKSQYANGKKILSDTDINNIIHSDEIRYTFINVVLQSYRIGVNSTDVQSYDGGDFPFSELIATFLSDLQDIVRQFMKTLHDGYNREPLNTSVFKLPIDDKLNAIEKKFEDVVIKTLSTIINDKDNLYSGLNYKYLLLNFH